MDSRAVVPASRRRRARRGESQWRALVGAFTQSGTTRHAFCAQHALSVSTFDWWRKRLGAMPCAARARARADALFVELTAPTGSAAAAVPVSHRSMPDWDVELELGAGVVLRLRRGAIAC